MIKYQTIKRDKCISRVMTRKKVFEILDSVMLASSGDYNKLV